jgi:hypothetical protein
MIHEDGTAKITDFGVAKIVSQQMTVAGTMMGTPSYMSPEQIQGGAITGRTDQFSLAVVVYEALTGEKPFTAEYLPTLLYRIVREEPLSPQRLNITLGSQVEPVLRKALAKNSAERYETCVDFISALAVACNATPGWIPLPRGASQNMPTGGWQEGLGETVADVLTETVAAALPEAAQAIVPAPPEPPSVPAMSATASGRSKSDASLPPVWQPRRRQADLEPSHTARNIMLAVLAFAVAGMALFLAYQQFGWPPFSRDVASSVPEKAPAAAPTPEQPPPPPPEPARAEPESAAAPAEAKTEPPVPSPAPDPAPRPAPFQAKPPATPADGIFQINATPAGATATFDKSAALKCVTPCKMTLPSGRHTFLVQSPGYRDAQRIIDIPHDTGFIVNLERMQGMLTISTNPSVLAIVIDGQEQARKSPATFVLPPGPHNVEVVKGSERHALSIEIHDGSTVERNVDLSQ